MSYRLYVSDYFKNGDFLKNDKGEADCCVTSTALLFALVDLLIRLIPFAARAGYIAKSYDCFNNFRVGLFLFGIFLFFCRSFYWEVDHLCFILTIVVLSFFGFGLNLIGIKNIAILYGIGYACNAFANWKQNNISVATLV